MLKLFLATVTALPLLLIGTGWAYFNGAFESLDASRAATVASASVAGPPKRISSANDTPPPSVQPAQVVGDVPDQAAHVDDPAVSVAGARAAQDFDESHPFEMARSDDTQQAATATQVFQDWELHHQVAVLATSTSDDQRMTATEPSDEQATAETDDAASANAALAGGTTQHAAVVGAARPAPTPTRVATVKRSAEVDTRSLSVSSEQATGTMVSKGDRDVKHEDRAGEKAEQAADKDKGHKEKSKGHD